MKYIYIAVFVFSYSLSYVGDRKNGIFAGCIVNGVEPLVIASCTGGLLTVQGVKTCISTPNRCFSKNNTIRIILTNPSKAVGDLLESLYRIRLF